MAKKIDTIAEIKKLLDEKKLIVGSDRTLKNLRAGKTGKIFICNNPPETTKADLEHYSKIAGVEVITVDVPNDELGILCKKPFAIAVLSTLK